MSNIPVDSLIFLTFLIFAGAAVLCTLALYTRQSMLVAYIALGVIVGPFGLRLIPNAHTVSEIGEIGIIFLLFLLGLNMQPKNLLQLLQRATIVTMGSSVLVVALSCMVTYYFGYSMLENIMIGLALLFSSTIIGLKLLPTTVLQHRHTGEVVISILLLQDLIALVVLMMIHLIGGERLTWQEGIGLIIALPLLVLIAFLLQRFVLIKLLKRFESIREYIFLLAIGWCLTFATLGPVLGLSPEIGAFIAGVVLAEDKISQYIADNLKPLRDFFLITFFFSIGATFNPHYFTIVIEPAIILALVILLLKPLVYRYLLRWNGESKAVATEVGVRLGQASEFSLLVAYLAASTAVIGSKASYLIQATTIITFIVSSYLVVLRYPNPMAMNARLRRD